LKDFFCIPVFRPSSSRAQNSNIRGAIPWSEK
jgi:hypothetical protein